MFKDNLDPGLQKMLILIPILLTFFADRGLNYWGLIFLSVVGVASLGRPIGSGGLYLFFEIFGY